jgi:hypothetical protein
VHCPSCTACARTAVPRSSQHQPFPNNHRQPIKPANSPPTLPPIGAILPLSWPSTLPSRP